jgi:hypothetical protein
LFPHRRNLNQPGPAGNLGSERPRMNLYDRTKLPCPRAPTGGLIESAGPG